MPLLALGPHIFEIAPLNFQQIERETEALWPAIPRFGGRPGAQSVGFGEGRMTISGLLFPDEFGGRAEFEAIRETQGKRRPVMMLGWATTGAARVFGRVVILKVSDSQTAINAMGLGRRLSFSIEVKPHPGDGRRGG
ncbi:MAG TPA: phage tail protein [Hyphomicrobiales bacterium]|nr:phage tail protein [Kaistiaceae bacterium]HQF30683.1 phage tail protein [Hyphomicrobiales bacterium]